MHYGIEMWKYAKTLKRQSADPRIGHEHVPGGRARLMGVDVQINERGLREREFASVPQEDVFRILVLGDSMTFGWGAPVDHTYPKVLEYQLNEQLSSATGLEYEVINAGVGNYNTDQEVAYFRQRGIKLEPDLVILGFYINDAEPTPRPHGGLLARHSYLYVLGSSFWEGWQSQTNDRGHFEQYYRDLYREDRPGWLQCQSALTELAGLCQAQKMGLLVLMIPELHSPAEDYAFDEAHRKVQDLLSTCGVEVLEIREAFAGIEPSRLWVSPGDAHPNAEAHRRIALALYDALRASSLMSATRTGGSADRTSAE